MVVEPPNQNQDAPASPQTRSARPSVLLVEDNWSTQAAIRKIFTRMGWDVLSALTVASGLAMLGDRPDAVILDLMLPDGDGLDVLRKARSDGLLARVVVATGVEDPRRLEEVQALRPDALLRKPLGLDELLGALGVEWPG